MKFDYNTSAIHTRYDGARALPDDTMACWMEALVPVIAPDRVRTVVDLGCGTGRFCRTLAATFHATVIGVEPSEKMQATALENLDGEEGITILPGSAEEIPVGDGGAELVFMSMIYHYLPDIPAAMREIARVLAPGGYLAIRNAVRENLDAIPFFRFFPEALELEKQRMPTRDSIMQQMEAGGFTLISCRTITQRFAESHIEYLQKIEQRGLSVLNLISDEQFHAGVASLREYALLHADEPVYEEVELLIGRR